MKRLLREIRREVAVPGHPMHQPVDPLDVGVVQRPLRGAIAIDAPGNEVAIHRTRIRGDNLRQG